MERDGFVGRMPSLGVVDISWSRVFTVQPDAQIALKTLPLFTFLPQTMVGPNR